MVLDISNLLYRTYYANKNEDELTIAGLAQHQALLTLNKYYNLYKPDKIVMAFDRKNWRVGYTLSEACVSGKKYKGNRRKDMTEKERAKYEAFMEHLKQFEELMRVHTSVICLAKSSADITDISLLSGLGNLEMLGREGYDDFKNRSLRIRELQIKDLIQEGTLVKKGDWVATLDIASINRQIEENNDDIEEDLADFEDAKIDSTIELTNYREEIKEFNFDLEYKALELEQAKFESLAFQRKAKVAYNKILRQMDAKLRNYERKKNGTKS